MNRDRAQEFTGCTTAGHRTCAVRSPFTPDGYQGRVVEDLLGEAARNPWALAVLFALVLGDAFLVVIPGEAAVTALGALSVSGGQPPLVAIIAVATVAAVAGDATCYLVGRTIGLERWRWMRTRRVRATFAWARARLHRRAGLVLFTARFIPFARLAVNLTAGATRIGAVRYLAIASLAAFAWALYQALIGAAVAAIVPGGPVVAVIVSVALAIGIGLAIDAILARRLRAYRPTSRLRRGMTAPDEGGSGQDGTHDGRRDRV